MRTLLRCLIWLGTFCLLSLFAGAHLLAKEITLQDEFAREITLAPGGELSLDNMVGTVELTSWDRNVVSIRATKIVGPSQESCGSSGSKRKWLKDSSLSALEARELLEKIEIRVSTDSNCVTVETVWPEHQYDNRKVHSFFQMCRLLTNFSEGLAEMSLIKVNYQVSVPRGTRVKLNNEIGDTWIKGLDGEITASGDVGKIFANNSSGSIEAHVGVGQIVMNQVKGSVSAKVELGSIEVERETLGLDDDTDLSTELGNISLEVPAQSKAELDLEAELGAVHADVGDRFEGESDRSVIKGSLKGGGPRIRMRTEMGNLSLNER